MDKPFIVERTSKGFNVFKIIKTLFGKEKKIEINKDDFFNFSSEYFKETKKYTLCPNIENMPMDVYLKEKFIYNNRHYFSDLNMRTTWTYDIKNEDIKELKYLDKCFYLVKTTGIVRIYMDNGELFSEVNNFRFNYLSNYKYSKRYIELLMQNACNGIYQKARDIDEMYREFYKMGNLSLPIWCCDVCLESFMTLDEFCYHLIEEGHPANMFEDFPYDKEVQRVKTLVENKINKKGD